MNALADETDRKQLRLLADTLASISRGADAASTLGVFVEHFGEIAGLRALLELSPTQAGGFRIEWARLFDRAGRPAAVPEGLVGSVLSGGVIVEAAGEAAEEPVWRNGLDSRDCAALSTVFDAPPGSGEAGCGVVVAPVFRRNEPPNRVVTVRDGRVPVNATHARLALSNANLLAQIVDRQVLLEEREQLNGALEAQLLRIGELQRGLLPVGTPRAPGYEFAVRYEPSAVASGDYYDWTTLPHGWMGVLIADVSGHGAAAATMMAALRTMVHTLGRTGELGEDPGAFAQLLNELVRDTLPEGMFVTAGFLGLEPNTGELTYSACGHPPALVVRAGGAVEPLHGLGAPPLGVLDDISAFAGEAGVVRSSLGPGDAVVLFTDGVTETFAPQGRRSGQHAAHRDGRGPRPMLGMNGLSAVLAAQAGASAEQIATGVFEHLASFSDRAPAADDRALVVIHRTAAGEQRR